MAGRRGGGEVLVLYGSRQRLSPDGAQVASQGSPGIPGQAETKGPASAFRGCGQPRLRSRGGSGYWCSG
jgi:hypothetical protein